MTLRLFVHGRYNTDTANNGCRTLFQLFCVLCAAHAEAMSNIMILLKQDG